MTCFAHTGVSFYLFCLSVFPFSNPLVGSHSVARAVGACGTSVDDGMLRSTTGSSRGPYFSKPHDWRAGFICGTGVAALLAAAVAAGVALRNKLQSAQSAKCLSNSSTPRGPTPLVSNGIRYVVGDSKITGQELHLLSIRSWGHTKPPDVLERALQHTINITARDATGQLVGSCRVLTDGFFSTIPEVLVSGEKQGRGIGRKLLELAAEAAPGRLSFGVQRGNEEFFERCGFTNSGMAFFESNSNSGANSEREPAEESAVE